MILRYCLTIILILIFSLSYEFNRTYAQPELLLDNQEIDAIYTDITEFSVVAQGGTAPYTYAVMQPLNGIVEHTGSNFLYLSVGGFVGQESFEITVTDANDDTASAQITVTIAAVEFVDDETIDWFYNVPNSIFIAPSIGVFPFTISFSQPSNGSVVELDFGSYYYYEYTPNSGFVGTDTFSITLTDDAGISDSGLITINIPEPNFIEDQSLSTFYNQALDFSASGLLEPDNPTIDIIQPANGTVTGDLTGFTYTPNTDFFGVDTFSITVTDDYGVADTAIFSVSINEPIVLASSTNNDLIQAIEQANANAGKDTIVLLPATDYSFTASYELFEEGSLALPEITDNLQIIGNNSTLMRQSSEQFGIFAVNSDNVDFFIRDVSISNANADYEGGAIFYDSLAGLLNVQNVIFTDNVAYYGGAIQFNNGQANIDNSQFINNHAQLANVATSIGGAIAAYTNEGTRPTITVSNSYFDGNTTDGNNTGSRGGAIYAVSVNLTVENNIFIRNAVSQNGRGGALYIGASSNYNIQATNNCILDNDLAQLYTQFNSTASNNVSLANNWWGSSRGILPNYMGGTISSAPALIEAILDCPMAEDFTLDIEPDVLTNLMLSADGVPPVTYTLETLAEFATVSGILPNITILNDKIYYGADEFSYRIQTADNLTATGYVTLNLLPDLDVPLVTATSSLDTPHQEPLTFLLDISGGVYPYTTELPSASANGVAFFDTSAYNPITDAYEVEWLYLPTSDFSGTETLTIAVDDANGNSIQTTVNITVGEEDPPTIFVDSTAYELIPVDNGNCTVAEALESARLNAIVDQCNAGRDDIQDIIYVPAGVYHGPLGITSNVVIRGAGITETIFERFSDTEGTVFDISAYVDVQFEHLSIRNGGANWLGNTSYRRGGGIYTAAARNLRLFDVVMFNHHVNIDGGAIYMANSGLLEGYFESYNSFYINNTAIAPGFVFEAHSTDSQFINNAFSDNGNNGTGELIIDGGFARIFYNCFTNPTNNPADAITLDYRYNWEYGSSEPQLPICDAIQPLRDFFFASVEPIIVHTSGLANTGEGGTIYSFIQVRNMPISLVELAVNIGELTLVENSSSVYKWTLLAEEGPFGPAPVTFTATNTLNETMVSQITFEYTVYNVPPFADVTFEPTLIAEGNTVSIGISNVTDPSPVDMAAGFTYSYACDLYVGYDVIGISDPSYICQYDTAGTYLAAGQIIDKDGGTQTYSVDIEVIERGDCNADTTVDAGDLSALQLEIFDDDTPSSLVANNFDGNPIGCDSNADSTIDAGDLSCVQAMIFDEEFVCGDNP